MMVVTAAEFKSDIGKYLALVADSDVFITNNGKKVAKLSGVEPDREERLERYEKNIMQRAVMELKELFGEKLRQVILYGSYAREDFDDESDVDIMVLVNMEREEAVNNRRGVRDISSGIGLENGIYVSMKLESADFFYKMLDTTHFYGNIIKDGRVLYGK